MFKRAAVAAFLFVASISLTGAATPSPYFIPLDLVEKIECDAGSGSGSWINDDQVLTAAHVVSAGHCRVDGQPTETIYFNGEQDLAVLRTTTRSAERIPVSCQAPRSGDRYYAVGYALGRDLAVQSLVGTDGRWGPEGGDQTRYLSIYRGRIIPGMSGGPIVDQNGFIVGIVNAYPRDGRILALSRTLTDTYLCPTVRP